MSTLLKSILLFPCLNSCPCFSSEARRDEVAIKMQNNTQEYNLDIVSILKSKNYSAAPYKCNKESESASSGNVVYVIESRGFMPLWLKDEWSCGSAGCAAYLTLYYSKKRADNTECYGS